MNILFNRFRFNKELKRLARENFFQGKPLSILDDVVFKAMLGSNSEDSNEALRSLLSACTRREVSAVQLLNNDLVPAHLGAKTARLDVHATFNDGETADLEIQAGKSADDLKKRAEFYTSMLMAGQHKRGKLYRDVKRVYQIFFLNCVLFPQSDKFPRRYFYQEEEEHDRLSEATEILFSRITETGNQIEGLSCQRRWNGRLA
jgi:predicted transposase/invertase (TIGR01784 family)